MRRFKLIRQTDVSDFSGTGAVVEGVQFSDSSVALRWTTAYSSWAVYRSIEDVIAIHGHEGATNVEWLDPDPLWAGLT
jgi:hypothetical protein